MTTTQLRLMALRVTYGFQPDLLATQITGWYANSSPAVMLREIEIYEAALAALVGDLNGDGVVNGIDLSVLGAHWQSVGGPADGDLNGDGVVDDGVDLSLLGSQLAGGRLLRP